MPNDTSIAQRCHAMGLRVVEVAGWQSRGRPYDFRPAGSVNHHTAGGAAGAAPSLNGVINGFHGSAPGPLANALQSREPDGNDIIYVVAAGVSNHAGVGGWKGLSGNSRVIGLEIEHVGTVPLPVHRQRIAARFHAAMAKGRWGSDMVCQHREWNPANKIDAATDVDPNQFRRWVAEAMDTPVREPPPKQEDEVVIISVGDKTQKPNEQPYAWLDNANRKIWSYWGFQIRWDGATSDAPVNGTKDPRWIAVPGTAPLIGWDEISSSPDRQTKRLCAYGLNGAEYIGTAHG